MKLLPLQYGSLFTSFLCEAKNPYLAAPSQELTQDWDMTILSWNIFINEEEEGGLLPHPRVVSWPEHYYLQTVFQKTLEDCTSSGGQSNYIFLKQVIHQMMYYW